MTSKIRVSYSVTRNAGNYESVKLEVGCEETVDSADKAAVYDALFKECYHQANKKVARALRALQESQGE